MNVAELPAELRGLSAAELRHAVRRLQQQGARPERDDATRSAHDAESGDAERLPFIKGLTVRRAAYSDYDGPVPALVFDGEARWLIFPNPKTRTGRQNVEVSLTMALPYGADLLAQVARRANGRSPASWFHFVQAANRVAAVVPSLGRSDEESGGIPEDLFARIEAHLLNERGGCGAGTAEQPGIGMGHGRFDDRRTGPELGRSVRISLNRARTLFSGIPAGEALNLRRDVIPADQPRDADKLVLDDENVIRLLKGCLAAILEAVAREARLLTYMSTSDVGCGPDDDELVRLAGYLRKTYPAGPPQRARIADRAVAERLKRRGYRRAARIAWPTAETMLPFAVMLGVQSRLNVSVLGSLLVGAFRPATPVAVPASEDGEGDRIEASPFKPRARRHQPVSFPVTRYPEDPSALMEFISGWTADLRPHAGMFSGHLYVFASDEPGRPPMSFGEFNNKKMREHLKRLCDRLGVSPVITPKVLRPIGVDIIHEAVGGEPQLVRAAGNWMQYETAQRFYLGPQAALRDDERMSVAVRIEARRLATGIDPATRPAAADRLSATDGFRCGDPFRGPLPQPPGDLCRARGMCAICPHGDVDDGAAAWSFASMVALAERLIDLCGDPEEPVDRVARWVPVRDELLELFIPLVPDRVIGEARLLPPMEQAKLYDD